MKVERPPGWVTQLYVRWRGTAGFKFDTTQRCPEVVIAVVVNPDALSMANGSHDGLR